LLETFCSRVLIYGAEKRFNTNQNKIEAGASHKLITINLKITHKQEAK